MKEGRGIWKGEREDGKGTGEKDRMIIGQKEKILLKLTLPGI